jgi:hypothetical protein
MDLKDFVKETVRAIAIGAQELGDELREVGAIINPPTNGNGSDTYEVGGTSHTFRRVQNIEFDVALTTSSSTSGGGKGGIKVFVVEASADATHARTNEEVSRVRFTIPVALPPSEQEAANRQAKTEQIQKLHRPIPPRR